MTDYTYSQLEQIWLQAAQGTKYATRQWAALMAAIGLAESSGNPNATNPTDNGGTQTSWGIWQISLGNHSEPSPTWNNPITNAQLAIGKLNDQGLTAWGTYDSGAYKQYYSGSTPPSTGSIGGGSGTTTTTSSQTSSQNLNIGDALQSMGTLLHGTAEVLNFFFEWFEPGQTWRLIAGVTAVGTGFATIKLYASSNGNDQMPLIFLLSGTTVLGAYMAFRPWPVTTGKPIRPAAYAVDVFQGNIPAGTPPANLTTPIEYGVAAVAGIWVVSKTAGIAAGAAGVLGGLWAALKGLGKSAESDLPDAASDLSYTIPSAANPTGQTVTV